MSAIGESGDRLSGTIAANIPMPTHNVLLVAWFKKNSTDPGSSDYVAELRTASETSALAIRCTNSSGYKMQSIGLWRSSGGSVTTVQQASALTQDVWRLGASYMAADAANVGVHTYDAGATATANMVSNQSATQGLTALVIGDGSPYNSFSFWNGKVAEVACFTVTGTTQRDAILAALETQTAAAVAAANPTATLVFYYPLLADETAVVGPALTPVGSPVFDSGDHPTLSSGGGLVSPIFRSSVFKSPVLGSGVFA